MVFVLVIISLLACRNDSGGVSPVGEPSPKVELQKDTEKRKPEDQVFYQPPIAEVSLPSKENKPKKEDWKLIDTYKVNGADLSGVGAVNHNLILLSDTLHSTLLKVDLESRTDAVLIKDMKSVYLNFKKGRLMMPQYDKDSVFVYRGEPRLFKFQIPFALDKPTSMDAFRIDDFVVVDRGNNRLVSNKAGDFKLIGGKGAGPLQFNNPSAIITIGNSLFLTDTGNKRIQKINVDNTLEKSFGDGTLSQPGGVTSDGRILFVCDEGLDQILLYNLEGNLLYSLKNELTDPRDIHFFKGRLFVSDAEGTVKIFENSAYSSL